MILANILFFNMQIKHIKYFTNILEMHKLYII